MKNNTNGRKVRRKAAESGKSTRELMNAALAKTQDPLQRAKIAAAFNLIL